MMKDRMPGRAPKRPALLSWLLHTRTGNRLLTVLALIVAAALISRTIACRIWSRVTVGLLVSFWPGLAETALWKAWFSPSPPAPSHVETSGMI